MNHKRLRTLYWIATIIFSLWLVGDGLAGVFQVPAGKDSLIQLGYPLYLLTILGFAKVLAALALIQTRYRIIKEWAFAGYAFDCIGAGLSWMVVGNTTNAVMAFVFLVVMFIPYYLWKKTG